jgi:hypothetical protein
MDRKKIVDYLVEKVFTEELTKYNYYIMLKNKQIYPYGNYGFLVESNKISPEDAFMYINFFDYSEDDSYNDPIAYLFPLVDDNSIYEIIKSYLAKLGFYDPDRYSVHPATGLKYYTVGRLLSDRLVIELTDFDTMVTNTGLRKIIVDMLGKNILTQNKITWDQIIEINSKLRQQKLFAGHDLDEAYDIIYGYYVDQNTSLAKEVLAITDAYDRIFQPYRVVYDTKTRQQVLM